MDLFRAQRGVREQAVAQMGEIAVRISRGGHALVHLQHVHALPGNVLGREGAQHQPGCVPAADGHDEAAARGHRRPGLARR